MGRVFRCVIPAIPLTESKGQRSPHLAVSGHPTDRIQWAPPPFPCHPDQREGSAVFRSLEDADMFVRIPGAPGQILPPSARSQATAMQRRDMVAHHGLILNLAFLFRLLLL